MLSSNGLEMAEHTNDALPRVEISLDPPLQPWPQLSAEIGDVDAAREKMESSMMAHVSKAMQQALGRTEKSITAITESLMFSCEDPVLRRTLASGPKSLGKRGANTGSLKRNPVSFLSEQVAAQGDDTITVQVQKEVADSDMSVIRSKLQAMEKDRNVAESKFFQQAVSEIDELAGSFIVEFKDQVDKQVRSLLMPLASSPASFLQRSHSQQANIQVVASDIPYPTLASMVTEMEQRRDTAENLARQKVAMIKLVFLQAANAAAKENLEKAVRVLRKCLRSVTN